MQIWTSLLAGGLGGLLGAAAALVGNALAQRREDVRLIVADRQRLRDLKGERLRRLYEPLLRVAMTLDGVVKEKGYTMEHESEPQRDARHERIIGAAMSGLEEVGASIVMEPGTDDVKDAYNQAFNACSNYLRGWRSEKTGSPFTDRATRLQSVDDSAVGLKSAITGQLADLENPIMIRDQRLWRYLFGRPPEAVEPGTKLSTRVGPPGGVD